MIRLVTLDGVSRRKDRSVSVRFITNTEQTSKEFMEMDENLGDSGIIYFKSGGSLTQEEIDEINNVDIEIEGKTKSQRLRNALYVLWEQNEDGEPFRDFYEQYMEKEIQAVKDNLE